MGGHLQTLLEGVEADAGQSIATLPLLTGTERQQLLVEWNTDQVEDDGKDEDGKDMLSHQLFEVQVKRTPDAVAVVFEDEQLTYGQLDRHANQLAHHLRALGVGPDVCVGICMERSPELVVAILGTLKAGGACVPMDPAYPLERLTFMLEDIQAPVVLTQERLLTLLSGYRTQAVCLDRGWERIAQESTELPVSNVTRTTLPLCSTPRGRPAGRRRSCGPTAGVVVSGLGNRRLFDYGRRSTPVEKPDRIHSFIHGGVLAVFHRCSNDCRSTGRRTGHCLPRQTHCQT